MSGTTVHHPAAPFTAPVNGTIEERLTLVAEAINRKADKGSGGPSYRFIGLIAPDGSSWSVTVDNAGVLHTTRAVRT